MTVYLYSDRQSVPIKAGSGKLLDTGTPYILTRPSIDDAAPNPTKPFNGIAGEWNEGTVERKWERRYTPPINTSPPAINEDPYEGVDLTGTAGSWDNTDTIERKWERQII